MPEKRHIGTALILLLILCSKQPIATAQPPYLERAEEVHSRLAEPVWRLLSDFKYKGRYGIYEWYDSVSYDVNQYGDTVRFFGHGLYRLYDRRFVDSTQVITYNYDNKRNKISQTAKFYEGFNSLRFTEKYKMAESVLGGYSKVEFDYDSLNRVLEIRIYRQHRLSIVANRVYDSVGRIAEEIYQTSVYPSEEMSTYSALHYTYFDDGNFKTIVPFKSSTVKNGVAYTFNHLGRTMEHAFYRDGKLAQPYTRDVPYPYHPFGPLLRFEYKDDSLLTLEKIVDVEGFENKRAFDEIVWRYNENNQLSEQLLLNQGEPVDDYLAAYTRWEYNSKQQPIWRRTYNSQNQLTYETRHFGESVYPLDEEPTDPKKKFRLRRKKRQK
ncbi:MAG: hypothetical protein JJ975_02475 [Bacteroidia bacterium]|nr:hypothetical protein [Bacteroidia bacterium]